MRLDVRAPERHALDDHGAVAVDEAEVRPGAHLEGREGVVAQEPASAVADERVDRAVGRPPAGRAEHAEDLRGPGRGRPHESREVAAPVAGRREEHRRASGTSSGERRGPPATIHAPEGRAHRVAAGGPSRIGSARARPAAASLGVRRRSCPRRARAPRAGRVPGTRSGEPSPASTLATRAGATAVRDHLAKGTGRRPSSARRARRRTPVGAMMATCVSVAGPHGDATEDRAARAAPPGCRRAGGAPDRRAARHRRDRPPGRRQRHRPAHRRQRDPRKRRRERDRRPRRHQQARRRHRHRSHRRPHRRERHRRQIDIDALVEEGRPRRRSSRSPPQGCWASSSASCAARSSRSTTSSTPSRCFSAATQDRPMAPTAARRARPRTGPRTREGHYAGGVTRLLAFLADVGAAVGHRSS